MKLKKTKKQKELQKITKKLNSFGYYQIIVEEKETISFVCNEKKYTFTKTQLKKENNAKGRALLKYIQIF